MTIWIHFSRYSYQASHKQDLPILDYQPIEDVERLERYRPGGYCPMLVGDILQNRYKVVHKLGHGTFSTVWLAHDRLQESYVAVKVSTAGSPSPEADCYVTSPARSSVSAAKFLSLFNIESARAIASQLVLAVAYIHSRGIVHDIHLGNVLLRLPSSLSQLSTEELYTQFDNPQSEPIISLDGKALPPGVPPYGTAPVWLSKRAKDISPGDAHILLSDFGPAFSPSKPSQTRIGEQCYAPLPVHPPEAYFQPEKPISFASDIWTLACAIWSLFSSRPLLDGMLATLEDIAVQQVDILGSLPAEWWSGDWTARSEYFDASGRPCGGRYVYPSLEECFEVNEAFLAMVRRMFVLRPDERATAVEVLECAWIRHWELPTFVGMDEADGV
ncbi:kinase domain-containing protein [Aspergillus heterothallicus]